MEDPPKKFFRLAPGREVRLRYGYFITCTNVVKDASGAITEIHCTYDPATRGGDSPDVRKVQGTDSLGVGEPRARLRAADVRQVFTVPDPDALEEGKDFMSVVNPESLTIVRGDEDRAECRGGSCRVAVSVSSGRRISSAT